VLNRGYAEQIARDWNTKSEPFAGYVTEFDLDDSYAQGFEPHRVGGSEHLELWVPAECLDEFNQHITGPIVVLGAFFGRGFTGEIPGQFMLANRNALDQLRLLSEIASYNGMDFICEIGANSQAVFLNYPFWLGCSPEEVGLSRARQREVLLAVRHCWDDRNVDLKLPSRGEHVA